METLQKLTRQFEIDAQRANAESRTAPVLLSTEHPVDRGSYIEVLDHAPDSVDLSRAPLPVLESHDSQTLNIGVVEGLFIKGRELRGTLRLGNSSRATEVWDDITAGVVRSVSIGYSVVAGINEDDGQTVRVTQWMPLEASLVAVPADPNAGLYRNLKMQNVDTPTTTETQSRSQRRNASSDTRKERDRVLEMNALGDRFKQTDLAREFIDNGKPVADLREAILERMTSPAVSSDTGGLGYCDYPGNSHEGREYSVVKAILAMTDPKAASGAGYEIEVSQELTRTLGKKTSGILVPIGELNTRAVTAGGTGGNLIATDYRPDQFIDLLRNKSAVMRQNITVLNGLQGDVTIPKKTSGSTAFWINADGTESLTESTPAFGQVPLSMKTVGGAVSFSHKMLVQGDPGIESLIREDLAAMLADEIDNKAINGDGTANTPTGILGTLGIGAATFALPGSPTFVEIVGMETALAAANADHGSMAYLTNATMAGALKTTDVGTDTGNFIWAGGGNPGEGRMNSYPAFASGHVPADTAIFGSWDDFIMGHWGVLEITADPYGGGNFLKGSVTIRALMDIDFAVRHPQAFTKLTGI